MAYECDNPACPECGSIAYRRGGRVLCGNCSRGGFDELQAEFRVERRKKLARIDRDIASGRIGPHEKRPLEVLEEQARGCACAWPDCEHKSAQLEIQRRLCEALLWEQDVLNTSPAAAVFAKRMRYKLLGAYRRTRQ